MPLERGCHGEARTIGKYSGLATSSMSLLDNLWMVFGNACSLESELMKLARMAGRTCALHKASGPISSLQDFIARSNNNKLP